jgi:hemerythrin-like domain-containing protein
MNDSVNSRMTGRTNTIPGHSAPAAGFDAPLEMLLACHQRIGRQCDTLRRLAGHLAVHGSDDQAREAAAGVLRYFDTAARHHHADEEEDLFPAIIESMAGSDAVCLRQLTEGLARDHRRIDAHWQPVRVVLQRVSAGEHALLAEADVEAFSSAYGQHIELEERELLPMAARLLSDQDLERLGRAMRERRGIQPGA